MRCPCIVVSLPKIAVVMRYGKKICRELKTIRKAIADANGIAYDPKPCNHRGDCAGTCPACDAEVRYIERELNLRKLAGKAAVVAGLSLGVASMTSCHKILRPEVNGLIERPQQLAGDVAIIDSVECSKTDTAKIPTPKKKTKKDKATLRGKYLNYE